MKAYKVMNPDWTCHGFKYEIGKSYHCDGKIELCSNGFHACEKAANCFNYYDFDSSNHVCEVELSGEIISDEEGKSCASDILIIKEIAWSELLTVVNEGKNCTGLCNTGDCNTGSRNTGDCNTGNCNTGSRNTGDCNTGNCNTGSRNTGNWNTGDRNTGFFNTDEETVRMFNKDTGKKRNDINFPVFLYFDTTQWVSDDTATKKEKEQHKMEIETCGGFLKELDYKTAFKRAWSNASKEEKEQVKSLPNFDPDIFFEISGIRV